MKNKLIDLNDHLFAQLERLGDESLTNEQLSKEIERSKAISGIAKDVVSNANLMLDAHKTALEYGKQTTTPEIISGGQPAIEGAK